MSDLLVGIARTLPTVVEPLSQALVSDQHLRRLLGRYGWAADELDAASSDTLASRMGLGSLFNELAGLAEELESGADDPLDTALRLIDTFAALGDAVAGLTGIDRSGLPFPLDQEQLWQELPLQIIDDLLLSYLESEQSFLFGVLLVFGLAEVRVVEPTGRNRQRYVQRKLRWDLLERAGDPLDLLKDVYRWGDPNGFDHQRLLATLARFMWTVEVRGQVVDANNIVLDQYYAPESPYRSEIRELRAPIVREGAVGDDDFVEAGFALLPVPATRATTTPPAGVLLGVYVDGGLTDAAPDMEPGFYFQLAGRFETGGGLGVEFHPGHIKLNLDAAETAIEARAGVVGKPPSPWILLGSAGSSRIELGGARAEVGVRGEIADPDVVIVLGTGPEPNPPKLALVLQFADADGFLQRLFGDEEQRVEVGGLLKWSSKSGLSLDGQARLTAVIPVGAELAGVRVETLTLRLGTHGKSLELVTALSGSATLGPVAAAVEGVGVKLELKRAEAGERRVFGDLALDYGFKPPDGAALSIDGAAITGGGFLFFDPKNEQYAGGMHLEFEGGLALNAIGLLTTRMPDGSRGFSLLVMVQASGFAPVQLGFGFTLNGVGGLLAINRTVAIDVLRAGVRNKTLDAILFSQDDPTPRAPQIVSTLQTVFPPAPSQYVFGPMALIGWGTPTLLTIEIALILELPAPLRLIALGRLRAALPDPERAIVSINLDVLGVIDFDRAELAVDATLYDSRVGPFALTGDMAARASWGSTPDFAMALGGFHPAYKPSPGFPQLRRLALALSTGNNPRVRMEAYFALTSNTVQVGARLELYVEAAGFSLEGGLGFDTLIQFSPFRLLAEIYARLALKRGATTLMGLDIHVHLIGPAPWVLWGEASFKLLFISISIPFRATIGRPEETPEIEREEVWAKLYAELIAPTSWTAQLPPDSGRLVVLRGDASDGEVLAHPLGSLAVSQRVVPLERTLELFGAVPPKGFDCFEIVGAGGLELGDDTTDYFAPAQFRRMSDAEKLSSPSFERMVSGVHLDPSNAVRVGHVQETPLDYEQSVILDIDQPAPEPVDERYQPDGAAVAALAEHGPAGTAELRDQGRAKFALEERGPVVAEPEYVVATKDGLEPKDLDGLDGTYTGAKERLRDHPDRDELQVVRKEEVVLA